MVLRIPDVQASTAAGSSTTRLQRESAPACMARRGVLVGMLAILSGCGQGMEEACEPDTEGCDMPPDEESGSHGTWSVAGDLSTFRIGHTASLLPDGQVLVVGGVQQGSEAKTSAELYDPRTGTWSPTGSLNGGRAHHTATPLPDGKVLIMGGAQVLNSSGGSGDLPLRTEVYDPGTGTWSISGSLSMGRGFHTTTLLSDGQVLVAGGVGIDDDNTPWTAEVYDPGTGTWSRTGNLVRGRVQHAATLLSDGRVLVTGGVGPDNGAFTTAEVYDPRMGTWSLVASPALGRFQHALTRMPDGKVLMTGGTSITNNGIAYPVTVEVYDPRTDTWSTTGSLARSRNLHAATLLSDGKVLVTCGAGPAAKTDVTAEVYDPATGTWSTTGELSAPRSNHSATLLHSGKVLVAGGSAFNMTELYTP